MMKKINILLKVPILCTYFDQNVYVLKPFYLKNYKRKLRLGENLEINIKVSKDKKKESQWLIKQ